MTTYRALLHSSGGSDRVAEYAALEGRRSTRGRTRDEVRALPRAPRRRRPDPAPRGRGDLRQARDNGLKIASRDDHGARERDRAAERDWRTSTERLRPDRRLLSEVEAPKPDGAAYEFALLTLGETADSASPSRTTSAACKRRRSPPASLHRVPEREHRRARLRAGRAPGGAARVLRRPVRRREPRRTRWVTSRPTLHGHRARPSTSRPTRRSSISLLYVDGAFRVGNPEIADSYRAVRALPDGGRRDGLRPLRRADARLLRPSRARR